MSNRDSSEAVPSSAGYAGDLDPKESWERLSRNTAAQLIDVRTIPEWNFVGVPDLGPLQRQVLFCEWQHFPQGANDTFVRQAAEALERTSYRPDVPLFFLCRSGARSRAAAIAMTAAGYGPCFNITDGFEGGLDTERHRGRSGGWKACGLPWIQT
ncbi:MAG TPA: rhodanese-like domain-containing protein [Micropepsaceae bacterium]|jgi:rhodanese-related sulfurtransferase